MLQTIILKFLNYCKHYHFSQKSLEAFSSRLSEFDGYLQIQSGY